MAGAPKPRTPHAPSGLEAQDADPPHTQVHASSVTVNGRALLILGASGSGKSSLALTLMAHGATLLADDRTDLTRDESGLIASCPAAIAGQIEARGVGILAATASAPAPVYVAIDLDQTESARLPEGRVTSFLGVKIPRLHKVETDHFAAALLQYLKAGKARTTP